MEIIKDAEPDAKDEEVAKTDVDDSDEGTAMATAKVKKKDLKAIGPPKPPSE